MKESIVKNFVILVAFSLIGMQVGIKIDDKTVLTLVGAQAASALVWGFILGVEKNTSKGK